MIKTKRFFTVATLIKLTMAFVLLSVMVACDNDDDGNAVYPKPAISEVEIGSGNNAIGVIGRDFHFNAKILAGDKIDSVKIEIRPRADENYADDWSFEIIWSQFKGAKTATVHEHFDIPGDAVEGKYDFVITIIDENRTQLEETYPIEIIDPANLPVNPELYIWTIQNDKGDLFYVNETLVNPENVVFAKNDTITSYLNIQNVKGDGEMYILIIKKNFNHRPETVGDIDFSKAIVYDVFEHMGEKEVFTLGNFLVDPVTYEYIRNVPELLLGAANDHNAPQPNPISGDKAWENGEYYFGMVYTNTTHNLSIHHYMEFTLEGF